MHQATNRHRYFQVFQSTLVWVLYFIFLIALDFVLSKAVDCGFKLWLCFFSVGTWLTSLCKALILCSVWQPKGTKVIPLCYLPSSPQGTVMNTCPALPMCIGRPGRLGNVAMCPAAEVSNPDAEPVRMATTVQGVVRYVTQNNIIHAMLRYLLSSLAVHC